MIRYSLICDNAHEFDSWFANSGAFDDQSERALVVCPFCDSSHVTKAIMSPRVARRDRALPALPAQDAPVAEVAKPAEEKRPVALFDEKHAALRNMVRELHAKIIETTVDVGSRFPEEARRIHDSETPEQPIRGQATAEEAKALLDEGIGILPIPTLPDERN
ncbi:MAG TPA: DUF1178 family protein [Beijerinckiaceae bacterium]|jgi:hypothetical protein|nr:DUF1178 family protein [Beijerinckiaceae bacterium]